MDDGKVPANEQKSGNTEIQGVCAIKQKFTGSLAKRNYILTE